MTSLDPELSSNVSDDSPVVRCSKTWRNVAFFMLFCLFTVCMLNCFFGLVLCSGFVFLFLLFIICYLVILLLLLLIVIFIIVLSFVMLVWLPFCVFIIIFCKV